METTSKINYPHFVQSKAECETDTFRFFTEDESLKEIKRLFPDGATKKVSAFYCKFDGRSLDDLPVGFVRVKAVKESLELLKKHEAAISGVYNLLHEGYQILIDVNRPAHYKVVRLSKVGTFRRQYVKHRLLKNIPRKIRPILKRYLKYVQEARKLNQQLWKVQENNDDIRSS